MSASPVRIALFALLDGDDALSALAAGGVHHQRAGVNTKSPYVIFNKQAGTEVWAFSDFYSTELWQVKGVCRGGDAEEAEAIDTRCRELLDDAPLDIDGLTTFYLRRETDIDLEQEDGAQSIFYVGGLYRLITEPA